MGEFRIDLKLMTGNGIRSRWKIAFQQCLKKTRNCNERESFPPIQMNS